MKLDRSDAMENLRSDDLLMLTEDLCSMIKKLEREEWILAWQLRPLVRLMAWELLARAIGDKVFTAEDGWAPEDLARERASRSEPKSIVKHML